MRQPSSTSSSSAGMSSSMRQPSSTSSSSAGMSSSSSSRSSSSMERPSLIMRWMRPAKVLGSSREKPEVRSADSKRRSTRSFTVLSLLSASARLRSSSMTELSGLISMVFLEAVGAHGVVAEGLGLHDALHVGAPAVFAGHQRARGVHEAVGDDDLLDLVPEDVLHEAAEGLELRLDLLLLLLLVLGLLELQALLGAADELVPVVLLELLHGVL